MTARSLRQLDERAQTDPDKPRRCATCWPACRNYQALPAEGRRRGRRPDRGLTMPFTTHDQQLSSGIGGAGLQRLRPRLRRHGRAVHPLHGHRHGHRHPAGAAQRRLEPPAGRACEPDPGAAGARASSGAIIAFTLLCIVFAVAVFVFGVRIAQPAGLPRHGAVLRRADRLLGLPIAAFGKTPEAARSIAMFAMLVMVMLGGALDAVLPVPGTGCISRPLAVPTPLGDGWAVCRYVARAGSGSGRAGDGGAGVFAGVWRCVWKFKRVNRPPLAGYTRFSSVRLTKLGCTPSRE